MAHPIDLPSFRPRLELAGLWQLAFDPACEGIRAGWALGHWPEARAERVQVPALWNVTHPDAEGVGFYRRVFTVPADWQGRVVRLHFRGASYRTQAWLNGAYVGSHEGAYTPFGFDVTPHIRPGAESELVVRVASLAKTWDVDGMVLQQSPASKQSWYYTHGGLWGEVYLEALPTTFCTAVTVEPDPAQEMVRVEAALENYDQESQGAVLRLEVKGPSGDLAATESSQVVLPPGESSFSYRIPLPRPLLWDCRNPHLYTLRLALRRGGAEVDSRTVRFGLRDFTVRDGRFFLNGEPILLRGLLLQPNYPITIVTPPTREMMVREITLAKEAGFNLIRAHIRPAPPGYLDLADELGMLVYAESCLAWIKDSPRLLDHGRRELRAMIERDRNHPSVVIWGINNENRAANALNSDELTRLARALDPTRVVLDNSGGTMAIDQDYGWADRTTVIPSREMQRQPIQDLHVYIGAPIPSEAYEWMRTLGISPPPVDMAALDFGSPAMLDKWAQGLASYRGQVFVSELGCGGMADLDQVVAGFQGRQDLRDAREMMAFRDSLQQGFAARRLDRVFPSVRELVRASQALQAAGLKRQVEALLANPRVSGYIVTQLNDVAWEFHAGLLDHWRNPKPVYEVLKRLQRPQCLILKAAKPAAACGERIEVALTLVSREPLQGAEEVRVTVQSPSGAERETSYAAPAGTGVREMGAVAVETGQEPGEWRVSARLLRDGEVLAESVEAILALVPPDLSRAAASVECLGSVPAAWADGAASAPGERPVLLAALPATLSEGDWQRLLGEVEQGRTGIIGALHPRDELARRVLQERGVPLQLHYGIGNWMGCYHWQPQSGLFAGLPKGLGGEAYVDVLPWYVMTELGGEVLAGSLRNTQTRREPSAILWYSDIEAIPCGRGRLIFCQYRIFEQAQANPIAATLARNLVRLAAGEGGELP